MPGRPNDQERKVALVTGSTGIVGRHIVMHLGETGGWEVLAGTRKGELNYVEPKDFGDRVKPVKIGSLVERSNVEEAFGKLEGITHLFHCAYATENDPVKDAESNKAMLVNVVETLEAGPSKGTLKHVYLQIGSKWYGQHLGKYPTPAKENDPRVPGPMLYFDQEDYIRERVEKGAPWTWSSTRPNPIIGYSPSSYMNLLNCVGVYAAITERLGLPFRFPGSEATYNSVIECCDVRVVAEAAVFTSTEPSAANNAYNVSNGDVYRWNQVWPRIAEHFGMQTAPPMKFSLVQLMNTPEKKAAWEELVQEHGLKGGPLEKMVEWTFGDFNFNFLEWDVFQSVTKLSRAGFKLQCLDTSDMWLDQLQRLIDMKIIPPLGKGGHTSGKAPKLEGTYDAVKARLEAISSK